VFSWADTSLTDGS